MCLVRLGLLLLVFCLPALGEPDLVELHEQQAFHDPDPVQRLEGQMALAGDIAKDPWGNFPEVVKLLKMLDPDPEKGAPREVRYEVTRVFYMLLMQIHDTQAARPIVEHLEALALEESKADRPDMVQGLLSAAMEGKKDRSATIDPTAENNLLRALSCGAHLQHLVPH